MLAAKSFGNRSHATTSRSTGTSSSRGGGVPAFLRGGGGNPSRGPPPAVRGHAPNCDCEVCSAEFPLRTHLLLDMSYSRLNQDQKSSGTSRFSFFSRKKPSVQASPDQTAITLAIIQEQRRASARAQAQLQKEAEMAAQQDPVTLSTLKQDSLIIPAARITHFFPAGHPIPSGPTHGRLRLLEAPEQQVQVVFHMMGHATHVSPALRSPLLDMYTHQRDCIVRAFKHAVGGAGVGGGNLQGMVLINLERGGEMGAVEFPFMVVWWVDARNCDANAVIGRVRQLTLDALDPAKTSFTCAHYFDTFEEVASLARPPLATHDRLVRRPGTPSTGYILTVFRVFEGDDGVKFERNWLGWSGARTLYKSLTSDVGLKRITLHKSSPQSGTLHYVLMCDCSNFLTCINHAVKAVPSLRMRLCGDTGLYRPICSC